MQCPQCLQDNPPRAKFCLECGSRLVLTCAQCGIELPPGAKFCLECGQPVGSQAAMPSQVVAPATYTPKYLAEKILTARSDLEGERKQVTVLFADIKGSTELIAGLDPEEARRLLDPALHAMMDAVHRYEGTVNQVLGDGIMALFGAPIAHEDHAARACYAALAMQAAMRRYGAEVRHAYGLEVQIRVGLNSGEVVVRAIDNDLHMDYSAIGQTTHLAARMEQLATPGSIRLTVGTLRLVEGLVQVTALGRFPVKGLSEPVEVFELIGASTVRRRLQASAARGLTRFVGRQTEIEALGHAQEQAGAGQGQVVAMVGEAGVGKSRLVYEFVHSHRSHNWLVLESASVSYGKATPYFPVIDLLRRYAHVEEHDNSRTIRARVTGQVLTLDDTLQDTIPALLWLLDALPEDSPFLQLEPPQRRQRTLAALKRVLLRESQVQSLLLIFEDLHWIDSETQALLDSLVESLPTARLLLLVNYRLAGALIGVGLCARRQGDIRQAIPALERSLALCQTANISRFFPQAASSLGVAYALAGRAAEALPLLEQTLERVAPGSHVIFHARVLTELSEALLLVGRVAEASALAGQLLELSRPHTGRGYQAHACRLLGEIAMRCEPPDVEQAAAHYHQALALAEEIGMRPLQAHCHHGLGTLYTTAGRREQARAELSAAMALYRAMDMTFWLPQVETALARTNTIS